MSGRLKKPWVSTMECSNYREHTQAVVSLTATDRVVKSNKTQRKRALLMPLDTPLPLHGLYRNRNVETRGLGEPLSRWYKPLEEGFQSTGALGLGQPERAQSRQHSGFCSPLSRPQHHCRNCGHIFCNTCSSNELALPSYPRPVRVCDGCQTLLLQRCSSSTSS